jgi:hypothetical protein
MCAPTPAQVDAKAKEYLTLKDALDRATGCENADDPARRAQGEVG